jgi:hypothetical protein
MPSVKQSNSHFEAATHAHGTPTISSKQTDETLIHDTTLSVMSVG